MQQEEFVIGEHKCFVYQAKQGQPEILLIQPIGPRAEESTNAVSSELLDYISTHVKKLCNHETNFAYAAFEINDWNQELSPWDAPTVFGNEDFGHGAEETLRFIEEEFLPEVYTRLELAMTTGMTAATTAVTSTATPTDMTAVTAAVMSTATPTGMTAATTAMTSTAAITAPIAAPIAGQVAAPTAAMPRAAATVTPTTAPTSLCAIPIILGGYSLAGLFSLWCSYQTDRFQGIAAVSPSVWFPGWIEFAEKHRTKADYIYLSLGDKEEKGRNKTMAKVGDCMRKQIEILKNRMGERNCCLEWNPGNHFQEPEIRTAKGFHRVMQEIMARRNSTG